MRNVKQVLDHGFVKLLNISGAVPGDTQITCEGGEGVFNARDVDPAKCARISFDNFEQDRSTEQDMKLVEYLMKNHHNTPMEMTEIWLEMKLPIFVARQFVRHRTACINEVSARYAVLPEEFYIPEVVRGKGTNNKQGSLDNLDTQLQEDFKDDLRGQCELSYRLYSEYLALGVAPEVARNFLHVNHYTHWVWKQDLSNLMHFLRLRLHEHAQWEAREYAQVVYDLLEVHLPLTMELFKKYKML